MKIDPSEFVNRKQLLGGIITIYVTRDGLTSLRVSFAKLGIAVALLALLGWVCLSTAAFFFMKYKRGYDAVTVVDIITMPFNYSAFQKKRGEFYIEEAFVALDEQDYKSALNLLRNGLVRSKGNIKARATLSEFYEFFFSRPQLAAELLKDGIPYLGSRKNSEILDYMKRYYSVTSRNQLDQIIVEGSELLLAQFSDRLQTQERALIFYQLATAHRNLNDQATSLQLIDSENLEQFPEGLVLHAQLLWDQGKEQLAIRKIESRIDTFQQNRPLFEKIIYFLREQAEISRAKHFSFIYKLSHPQVYNSHLAMLSHRYLYESADTNALSNAITEYLEKFSDNPVALQQVAILISSEGDVENVERVLALIPSQEAVSDVLKDFITIEAKIRARLFRNALAQIIEVEDNIENSDKPVSPDSLSILNSLKAACFHGLARPAESQKELDAFLRYPLLKINRFLAVANLLLEIDAPHLAEQVMDHCIKTQVYNQNVLETQLAIQIKSENLDKLSDSLQLAMGNRRLPNRILSDAFNLLSSDAAMHLPGRDRSLEEIKSSLNLAYLLEHS